MKTDGGAMKVFKLIISFLLVATTTSGVVAGQKEAVLDTRENPVKANVEYYLRGLFEGRQMWITSYEWNKLDPLSCPQSVVLSNTPLRIEPVIFKLSSDVVRVSTELNIQFTWPSLCAGSRYWRVEDSSKAVVLEGSKSSNDSTFNIQKLGGSYKFVFESGDKPTDIGLQRIILSEFRLILSNNSAFSVSFVPPPF